VKVKIQHRDRKVTAAIVSRVSWLVGLGLTLEQACKSQPGPVSSQAFSLHLRRHPEHMAIYERGRHRFLAHAVDRLAKSKDLADVRWLLERRFSSLFARPEQAPITIVAASTVEWPSDFTELVRKYARQNSGQPIEETQPQPGLLGRGN
jgi:hypothetical protein